MVTKKYITNLTYKIIGRAIEVHKILGPGLLENIYEECLYEELISSNFKVKKQTQLPIIYKGKKIENAFKIDLLVEDLIIIELKAVEKMIPLYDAQLLTYMKLMNISKGLLINFHTTNITNSLKQFVNEKFAKLPE